MISSTVLMDRLATALSANLAHSECSRDDALVEIWSAECIAYAMQRGYSDNAAQALVQIALERAFAENYNTTIQKMQSSTAATSFSIFDQMDINIDFISFAKLQAADAEERYTLFQTAHVDDLVFEWEDISVVLWESFHHSPLLYLHLFDTWFDQSAGNNNNAEYNKVQLDLGQQIVTYLDQSTASSANIIHRAMKSLFKIWIHWMLNQSLDVDSQSIMTIGSTLINWHSAQSTDVLLIALSQMDPRAKWLHAWFAISPRAMAVVKQDKCPLVPWAMSQTTNTTCCYARSILRALLVTLRVANFPWEQIDNEHAVELVFDRYLGFLADASPDDALVCLDAVDTILQGLQGNVKLLESLISKAKGLKDKYPDLRLILSECSDQM
jgi:hypothetical protein